MIQNGEIAKYLNSISDTTKAFERIDTNEYYEEIIFVNHCGLAAGKPFRIGLGDDYFTVEQSGVELFRRAPADVVCIDFCNARAIYIAELGIVDLDDATKDEVTIFEVEEIYGREIRNHKLAIAFANHLNHREQRRAGIKRKGPLTIDSSYESSVKF